ncbi:MAG TPA: phosphoribosyl-ATP diphosphatase [Spirochaetota bacterium]|nr:phosphoribosyl-ATP diphosphatase [Spirochaetota bacterium]
MVKIDFSVNPLYDFNVFNEDKVIISKGLMNSKAWSKTLETEEVWEYINENGRVISKDFSPLKFAPNSFDLSEDEKTINIYLKNLDKKSASNASAERERNILERLEKLISKRKLEMPQNSYTTNLFEKGLDKILKKLGEETIELIIASKDKPEEVIYETADLIYHLMVLFVYKEIPFNNVLKELSDRMEK